MLLGFSSGPEGCYGTTIGLMPWARTHPGTPFALHHAVRFSSRQVATYDGDTLSEYRTGNHRCFLLHTAQLR